MRGHYPLRAAARGPQGPGLDPRAGAAGAPPARRPRMSRLFSAGGEAPRAPGQAPALGGRDGFPRGRDSLAW